MVSLRTHQPPNHQSQSARKAPTHELREITRWSWSGRYEATASSKASQEDVAALVAETKKGWWNQNVNDSLILKAKN